MAASLTRTSLTRVVVPPPVHWHRDDEDKLLDQIAEHYSKNREILSNFKYADACPSGYELGPQGSEKYETLKRKIRRFKAKQKKQRQQREAENIVRWAQQPPGGQYMYTRRTALGNIQPVCTSFKQVTLACDGMR